MDMQSTDQDLAAFADVLEFTLATTLPVNPEDAPDTHARKLASAQRQFAAFHPTTEAEAQEAAAAVALMLGAVDSLARAAKPGVGGETAGRLRSNALSAIRFYATTLKNARKRAQAEATAAQPASPPQDEQPLGFPKIELFQPRDRRGNPIPAFRYDLLTTKQKRAAYDYANKAAWAEATAEEDAAIAEQAEIDAQNPPTEEQLAYYL
ncbi:MAG TPA: hypothetical protein VL614_20685, partial [Acetobacteraceae bacterium]|nr:hypothetical protein [Acetobacteraceae bacterium]